MILQPTALFTLDQLKGWLKIKGSNSQDDLIGLIGQGASDYCEQRIGQQFLSRAYTITRNGDGRCLVLRLPRPISAVASVTIDGQAMDPANYVVDPAGKIALLNGYAFTKGLQNVVLVLTAGYTRQTLPGDVVVAALDLAKSHYEEIVNGAVSVSAIHMGPASTVIKPGLNPRIEKFLDGRRDPRV